MIKMLTNSVSGVVSLPGLWTVAFLLCPHMTFSVCVCVCVCVGVLMEIVSASNILRLLKQMHFSEMSEIVAYWSQIVDNGLLVTNILP